MNIKAVIEYLNKNMGYDISGSYYEYISIWRDWWKGFYSPFHEFSEKTYDNKIVKRKLYTLKMAKKVCEDWASILLNEKTEIVIDDPGSSKFIHGDDNNTGILEDNDFWKKANELIEKAFYSGTGAFVLRLENMKVTAGGSIVADPETSIRIEYLTALHIVPLTIQHGQIIDVAFVSEILMKGKKFIYIETHVLEAGEYTITNRYFQEEEGSLKTVALPEGILESFKTGSDIPLFAIIRPNIANNIDESTGLGISVYANAIDNLEGVDLTYNNFCRDFKLGGKKVFLHEQLTGTDENGLTLTPDDVAQQLFVGVGDSLLGSDGTNKLIQEFNPSLRVQDNKDGIQAQLDYLSFKCGLGTKHYQFNVGSVVTATQYMGDKQELVQNASKHYIVVEKALKTLIQSILWIGRTVAKAAVKEDTQITITFDDGYVIDKEAERLRDLQEIRDGIQQKWEYRAKWYGEDEETAKGMISSPTDDDLLGFQSGGAPKK